MDRYDLLLPTGWTVIVRNDGIEIIEDTANVCNSVTTAKIAYGSVTSSKLVDNAVTTPKIADNAVTDAKLSADSTYIMWQDDDVLEPFSTGIITIPSMFCLYSANLST
jgi:hypothetical protein